MRYFDDLSVGEKLPMRPHIVTREELVAFSSEFHPEPSHMDEIAASRSMLGGLSASGWHICSIMMRMMFDGWLRETASMGSPGIDKVKWLSPVRPGDALAGYSEIVALKASKSRPGMGIVSFRHVMTSSGGKTVLEAENPIMIALRPGQRSPSPQDATANQDKLP